MQNSKKVSLLFGFILATFMLFSNLSLAASSTSQIKSEAKFKAGIHYTILDANKTTTPELTEYFSYFCGHCFSFEKDIRELSSELPTNMVLNKQHISFMGRQFGPIMSSFFVASKLLGVEDKMTPIIFKRFHQQNILPRTIDDVKLIYLEHGVNAKSLNSALNNFNTKNQILATDRNFRELGLTGVPSLVVNGKYLINTSRLDSDAQILEIIKYLNTL